MYRESMQSPSSSSSDSHALSITKLTAVPEVLHMVFDMLFPPELGNLSLACKALHACVFSEASIRDKSVLRALEMSRCADVLPNGGFRLYTSMCRQFIDVRALPGGRQMIPEFHNNTQRPLVSMRHAGVRYIGRGPHLFNNEAGRDREIHGLFTAGNPVLLNAHSVRVHGIEHVQYQDEPHVVWTNVRIGVFLDEEANFGECLATLRFVADGW